MSGSYKWLSNSAIFAIIVALLLNNFFSSNQPRSWNRLLTRSPSIFGFGGFNFGDEEGEGYGYGRCGSGLFFAQGQTAINGSNYGNDELYAWQIGPLTPSDDCYVTSIWRNTNPYNPTDPRNFIGYAYVCYNKNNTLNVYVYGAQGQPVFCEMLIYVGYLDIFTTTLIQQSTNISTPLCLSNNSEDCYFTGPTGFVNITRNGLTGSPIYAIILGETCPWLCRPQCFPERELSPPDVNGTSCASLTKVNFFESTTLIPTETVVGRVVLEKRFDSGAKGPANFPPTPPEEELSSTTLFSTSTTTITETTVSVYCETLPPCGEGNLPCQTLTATSFLPTVTVNTTIRTSTTLTTPTTIFKTTTIDGTPSVISQVVTTTVTVPHDYSTSLTICTTEVPVPPPNCINIGPASAFNVYTLHDYQGSSDVQGRLLVGGNATITDGFSVGDQLKISPPCSKPNFIVGGQIFGWKTGRDYFGNIVVGKNSSIGPVLDAGCKLIVDPSFFDFNTTNSLIIRGNNFVCGLKSTVVNYQVDYGKLTLNFAGLSPFEVVEISNPNFFNGVVSFVDKINGLKNGTVLIFNIKGASSGIANMNMEAFKGLPVLFNFCGATKLVVKNVAVHGWILAPQAVVSGATGVVWGSIIVKSLSGSIQANIGQFPVCIFNDFTNIRKIVDDFNLDRILGFTVGNGFTGAAQVAAPLTTFTLISIALISVFLLFMR